jgi:hypothetical protein
MDVRWKFQRLGQDELERVAVGDPDPRVIVKVASW